jgi:OOP family OmpA-OmpF porin
MSIGKACLVIGSALALSSPFAANAQNRDSNSRAIWGWDDPSAERPHSWIPHTSYGYIGVGAGRSEFDLGRCAPGFDCDDKDTGYKIYTGGKFSRLLGVEAGYVNLGKGHANGGDEKAQGINVSLVVNLPIGDMFNIYAKGGGIYGWTHTGASPAAAASTGKDHGLNPSYGAGVQFDINKNWAIAGDWDHYRFDYAHGTDDATLYSFNVIFKY